MKRESILYGKSNEFAKLSTTDKLVCLDILSNNRDELTVWLIYTCRQYAASGVHVDADNLLQDIGKFEKYVSAMDQSN